MIEPYINTVYNTASHLLSLNNMLIMLMMVVLVVLLPLSLSHFAKGRTLKAQYMGARATGDDLRFLGSMGVMKETEFSNYYFEDIFGEEKLNKIGNLMTIVLLVVLFILISFFIPLEVIM
jgi:ech hydrogenase subunit A